jgi:hypothetical protein
MVHLQISDRSAPSIGKRIETIRIAAGTDDWEREDFLQLVFDDYTELHVHGVHVDLEVTCEIGDRWIGDRYCSAHMKLVMPGGHFVPMDEWTAAETWGDLVLVTSRGPITIKVTPNPEVTAEDPAVVIIESMGQHQR